MDTDTDALLDSILTGNDDRFANGNDVIIEERFSAENDVIIDEDCLSAR